MFKDTFYPESYLFLIDDKTTRSALTIFRPSAHNLHIETGRYKHGKERLKPNDRICKQCTANIMEDEFHFLMGCSHYKDIRARFFNKIYSHSPIFKTLKLNVQFIWLMANLDTQVIKLLADFIKECFKMRSNKTLSGR